MSAAGTSTCDARSCITCRIERVRTAISLSFCAADPYTTLNSWRDMSPSLRSAIKPMGFAAARG